MKYKWRKSTQKLLHRLIKKRAKQHNILQKRIVEKLRMIKRYKTGTLIIRFLS